MGTDEDDEALICCLFVCLFNGFVCFWAVCRAGIARANFP